jgi:hypothetical protein
MKHIFQILILIHLLTHCNCINDNELSASQRLAAYLLNNYQKALRPVRNINTTTPVEVRASLYNIFQVVCYIVILYIIVFIYV